MNWTASTKILFFVFRHILFVAQLNVSHVNEEQLARGGFVIHQGNLRPASSAIKKRRQKGQHHPVPPCHSGHDCEAKRQQIRPSCCTSQAMFLSSSMLWWSQMWKLCIDATSKTFKTHTDSHSTSARVTPNWQSWTSTSTVEAWSDVMDRSLAEMVFPDWLLKKQWH